MDIAVIAAVVAYALVERLLGRKDVTALLNQVTSAIAAGSDERSKLLADFARERAELLIRIQHPDVIVAPPAPAGQAPVEPERDEIDLVGTVQAPPVIEPEAPGPNA